MHCDRGSATSTAQLPLARCSQECFHGQSCSNPSLP
ncbi:hypothetical protein MC7420_6976 [Coleofasciculus chthonoplastes PCC 7420]|uniref:Uncharacterized protein n=1 Tax=Coleofasciculus chthonoplastes PCC 7420 TaxID=118168 RepID=B4W1R9_9CYAN|nr:hypothetical protein MC7420_6976 [Coleofasciculus chthonoplastes PCC 7420]